MGDNHEQPGRTPNEAKPPVWLGMSEPEPIDPLGFDALQTRHPEDVEATRIVADAYLEAIAAQKAGRDDPAFHDKLPDWFGPVEAGRPVPYNLREWRRRYDLHRQDQAKPWAPTPTEEAVGLPSPIEHSPHMGVLRRLALIPLFLILLGAFMLLSPIILYIMGVVSLFVRGGGGYVRGTSVRAHWRGGGWVSGHSRSGHWRR